MFRVLGLGQENDSWELGLVSLVFILEVFFFWGGGGGYIIEVKPTRNTAEARLGGPYGRFRK